MNDVAMNDVPWVAVSEDENTTDGSYGEAIRDRLLSEAMRLPFFASFLPVTTRGRPIAIEDLPILACYIGEERQIPEGDGRANGLKFIATLRLNWSIMIVDSDKEAAERRLERAYVALLYGLWGNPYLTSMLDTLDPDLGVATRYNARFSSIPQQSAQTFWGAFLLDNETPVAEKRWEIQLQYTRSIAPRIVHDLDEVHITTKFPPNRTPEQIEQIQQIRLLLTFTPSSPPK
jgi:hypothetical protein